MLSRKIAVVTGSTSGIGLAIATALAAEGVDIVLNGFGDPAEIERHRAALAEAHGVRAAYVAADMAKPAEIRGLVAEAERRFGGVDILVNNAGIQHVAKIVDFPEERWDQVIAINLAYLAGGVIVVEYIFNYPGIGSALVDAVNNHDIPVVQALAMLIAAVYVGVNLLADIGTILVTPRLRTRL